MVQNWCRRRSEIYTLIHLLASELELPACFLLLAMLAISGYDSASTFSHIEKIATLQILKNKIDELGDMINFSEFPLLSLERLSVVTSMHYVCYLEEENQSGSSVNKSRYS